MNAGYCEFVLDERLGIRLPRLTLDWEQLPSDEQERILHQWENIRGMIPDKIKRVEFEIICRQNELNDEEDFARSCRINTEIAELASIVNDLNLWFRVNQQMTSKRHLQ